MALPPGTRLGPYSIVHFLGAGGMGEVYRAEDSRLRRTVAIKILSREAATPDRVERFEREARAASALNHPNILTIYDVGREGNTAWFAMEWVDGQTLRALLSSGPVPLRRTVALAHQMAEGLARAHAAGIVHRDVKPENVMVTRDGLAKIVDFGLAKVNAPPPVENCHSTVAPTGTTEPGLVIGTIGYLSPEQASGRPVDFRSDQFSLGVLLYELVTRTRPFERATAAQSLAATIEADPPPLETLNADIPQHLSAVVERLLAKDPAERYESTRDLAWDLRSVMHENSRHPHRIAGGALSTSQRLRPRWMPPRPFAAIAIVVLLAAAAWMAWLWRSRSVEPVPDRPLVAVRPFRNLSVDPQRAYFADGMTEEIRGQLSHMASLRLLSRDGLDGYRDDMSRAVRELGVRSVVDGSVRVEGNRVRVSAELVDAPSRHILWSDQYDRDLADILAVQGEIAEQIARALRTSLSPAERQRIQKRPTASIEAYTLYLRSQQLPMNDPARNVEALQMLRKAIALDPRFAVAQVDLAYRLIFMGLFEDEANVDEGMTEAEAALRIDPDLSDAHFALASGYMAKGMGAQSRQAFLRALELDPNNAGAMNNLSITELQYGRLDEAVYWGRRGFLLTGKTGDAFPHLVMPLLILRADVESRILLEEAERRSPTSSRVGQQRAALELFSRWPDQAIVLANAVVARFPSDEEASFMRADIGFLLNVPDLERYLTPLLERSASRILWVAESIRLRYAYALGRRGESAKAVALIAEAERIAREKINAGNDIPSLRVELAAIAALRNDTAAALDWLERAFVGGYRDYGFLERDPILVPQLGTDPRFRDLLDRIRSDVETQRDRARARGLLEVASLLAPAK